jgi:hypothetical protein
MGGDQVTSLGWVGVGRMGRALVMRLLRAGHEVTVYNRTREKAADLEAHGAVVVDTPADLADRDIVFTMVAGSADVEQVCAGLLSRPDVAPGLIVDSTTISPSAAEQIRARAPGARDRDAGGPGRWPQGRRVRTAHHRRLGPRAPGSKLGPIWVLCGRSPTSAREARAAGGCHPHAGSSPSAWRDHSAGGREASRAPISSSSSTTASPGSTFTRYKSPA